MIQRLLAWLDRRLTPTPIQTCGAIDWGWGDRDLLGEDDDVYVIVYGVCDLPEGHEGPHCEHRPDGSVWAAWRGDDGPIPDDVRITR